MANLALVDLVSPYLLKADNLGAYHAALSVIRVSSYSIAASDDWVVIRGYAEFNGKGLIDIGQGRLQIVGTTNEAAPPFDPRRRSPVFNLAETSLDFEIVVPRDGSLIIGQGAATITAIGFNQTKAVLDVWDALPVDPAPSVYPSSGFILDLIINAPSIRPPFLHPAKMNDRGLLEPDTTIQEVSFCLPRLRFCLAHGSPVGSQLRFDIVLLGTQGLDDPGNTGEAELIAMMPPYAFIGGASDRVVGIGFRKAVLDLSANATPPEVVSKFGFGDDWSGLYLPEVRIFVAPNGAQDLAIEVGVQDLLIGFGASHSISGDFELAVIDQGHGDLALSARFFDAGGRAYGIERLSAAAARAILPAQTRMVIDIQGGLPPYTISLNGAASSRLYSINLTGNPQQSLLITGHDSTGGTPKTAVLTLQAHLRTAQATLPPPGAGPAATQLAVPDPAVTDPQSVIAFQTDTDVTLTTNPQNAQVMWSISNPSGGAETCPQATFTLPLGGGETKTVRARLPGTTVPTELFYYFYFDDEQAHRRSIGASAELDVLVVGQTGSFHTHIHGQACGHVDFFFSVEGCVDVTLGSPSAKLGIPDLVEKLSIKSRSPALLVGAGVDRPIDTSLGKGIEQNAPPSTANKDLPIVPIDSVLVVGMRMPPIAAGLKFADLPVTLTGTTGQTAGSFVDRGSEKYAYTLTAVTLERADGGPSLLGSNAPSTWWTPSDASSDNVNAQLALLTWEPDPATKALEKTEQRTEQIRQRWQRACDDAAKPARVLWTFLDERLGASPTGWDLEGVAWPDPPNTLRKQTPPTSIHVSERWRCGDPKIDALRGIIPALVLSAAIECQRQQTPPQPVNLPSVIGELRGMAFDPALARRLDTL